MCDPFVIIDGGSGSSDKLSKNNIGPTCESMGFTVERVHTESPETVFGEPESPIVIAELKGDMRLGFMFRHGEKHIPPPSNVSFGGNAAALKKLGVTHSLAQSACGALTRWVPPGTLALISQYLDFTFTQQLPFFGGPAVHLPMAYPTCLGMGQMVCDVARQTGIRVKASSLPGERLWAPVADIVRPTLRQDICCLCIRGPAYSTRDESKLWRKFGAHLVGMSIAREAPWFRAAGIHYICLGLSTDYDSWLKHTVNVEMVIENLKGMVGEATDLLLHCAKEILLNRPHWRCDCQKALSSSLQTNPDHLVGEYASLMKRLRFLGWRPPQK